MRIVILCALLLAGALGYFAGTETHRANTVHAAEAGPISFQLQGSGSTAQLWLHTFPDHEIYVYQGVLSGASDVPCAYKLHFDHAGAPLQRTNCGR